MYLTPHQKKQLRLVLILVIGLPLTIFAGYQGFKLITNANIEAVPKDIAISNVTTNSLTITWVTEKESDGYIIPILNGSEQSPVRDKRGSGKKITHYVELKSLEPDTKYNFQIVSDGGKYSNSDGKDYEFTTAQVTSDTPVPNPIHGNVSGADSDDVIIYALLKNKTSYPVSVIPPSGGTWLLDLSTFRSMEDDSLIRVTDDTELIIGARSSSSSAAVIEGKYSELFDSNGKLNQTYTLEVGDNTTLLTYFPENSILTALAVVEPKDEEPKSTPTVTPKPTVTPTVDDKDDEPVVDKKDYEIVKDVKWQDMISTTSNSNLDNGEDSVLITNLTDVSFTAVWRSASKEEGSVQYGLSETELTSSSNDVRDGLTSKNKYYSHSVEVTRLSPETTYYFEVVSGSNTYDNNGQIYTVTTHPTLSSPPPFETRSGSLDNTDDPSDWILVARLKDEDGSGSEGNSMYLSTLPDDNGNWILTIGDSRTEDGLEYFTYSSVDTLEMFLVGDDSKIFSYKATQSDLGIDSSEVGSTIISEVQLLKDYGITF